MISVNMRLAIDYAASELNDPTLVWPAIPLVGKQGDIEERRLNSTMELGVQCDCYFRVVTFTKALVRYSHYLCDYTLKYAHKRIHKLP